ncbi:hypothetical protein D3C86_1346920 [compost metagenome]
MGKVDGGPSGLAAALPMLSMTGASAPSKASSPRPNPLGFLVAIVKSSFLLFLYPEPGSGVRLLGGQTVPIRVTVFETVAAIQSTRGGVFRLDLQIGRLGSAGGTFGQ